MKLGGKWKTYIHSLVGIAIAMILIGVILNLLRTRGPAIVQGPAATAGSYIYGTRYHFP